jgi:hypothetical protein
MYPKSDLKYFEDGISIKLLCFWILSIGETRRLLETLIKEYKYNLMQGLLGKLKLSQHTHTRGMKR